MGKAQSVDGGAQLRFLIQGCEQATALFVSFGQQQLGVRQSSRNRGEDSFLLAHQPGEQARLAGKGRQGGQGSVLRAQGGIAGMQGNVQALAVGLAPAPRP